MTITTEYLHGRLDDGSTVVVVKQTAPLVNQPDLDALPSFSIQGGEALTPIADDLTAFVTIDTRIRVRIVGPAPGS